MSLYKALAIKAVENAEKSLAEENFVAAKENVLNAQSLCPELEGIPQMLKILEVYIASTKTINGVKDWYGVLGVDPSADDGSIKKQYKRMALALHPDKNKSVGADGAFKLISNAWSLLSDKNQKLAYDWSISAPPKAAPSAEVAANAPQEQGPSTGPSNDYGTHTSGTAQQPNNANNYFDFFKRAAARADEVDKKTNQEQFFSGSSTQPSATFGTRNPPNADQTRDFLKKPSSDEVAKNKAKEQFASAPGTQPRVNTFWTVCHKCKVHFEYDRVHVNTTVICYNCETRFRASETPHPVESSKSRGSSSGSKRRRVKKE